MNLGHVTISAMKRLDYVPAWIISQVVLVTNAFLVFGDSPSANLASVMIMQTDVTNFQVFVLAVVTSQLVLSVSGKCLMIYACHFFI
jgi:hypothetical protein